MKHPWEYPVVAFYHSAMANFASSEANLPHFLERALEHRSQVHYNLVAHNIALHAEHQATAIAWASRD